MISKFSINVMNFKFMAKLNSIFYNNFYFLNIYIMLQYEILYDLIMKLHIVLFINIKNNILLNLPIILIYHFIFISLLY